MEQFKICHSCGKQLDLSHKFCVSCGTPQESDDKLCGRCNAELKEGAKFCTRCGLKIEPDDEDEIEEIDTTEGDEDKKLEKDHESHVSTLLEVGIPDLTDLENHLDTFDKVRKSSQGVDDNIKLKLLVNWGSSIMKYYTSRPYLIRSLQSYEDAYHIATEQENVDLANQLRFVLANLNLRFGDLIPKPSRRKKYYDEAFKIVKELQREVEDGDILGKDAASVFILKAELLQRKSRLKKALVSINVALELSEQYQSKHQEALYLKSYLLTDSARYEEALEVLDMIDDDGMTVRKNYLQAQISNLFDNEDIDMNNLLKLSQTMELDTSERINIKLQLINKFLKNDTDKALETFETIFDEELDPAKEEMMKHLGETLEKRIKKMKVSDAIKRGKTEDELHQRMGAIRNAQGRENWDQVIFNARRYLEIIEDYSDDLDPDHSQRTEVNFRLGNALFHNEEYEQAFAYFDNSVEYYEQGVGEPTQYPTALRHLVDTQVRLGQYEEAYNSAQKGLQVAKDIGHKAIITEFEKRVENLNPERIKNLQKFNEIITLALSQMSEIGNFNQLYRVLGLDTGQASANTNLFIPLVQSLLRSNLSKSVALLSKYPELRYETEQTLNRPKIRRLIQDPISTLRRINNFTIVRDLFKQMYGNKVPMKIAQITLVESMIVFILNVRIQSNEVRLNVLLQELVKLLRGIRDEILAVMILAGIVKSLEMRVN